MESEQKIVHTHTFGCKVNWYDTSAIERLLEQKGQVRIDHDQALAPDTIVINTCTVTQSADKQAKHLIRKVSRKYPQAKIVVTGCYAQHKPHEINDLGVSHVLPIKEQYKLPQLLGWGESHENEFLAARSKRTRANLKMQNGCNAYCSFCILPYIRGKSSSIPLSQILEQAKFYSDEGHHELVLTGTHIGGYGRDFSTRMRFSDAVLAILNHVPKMKVRISSLEPTTLTPDVIRLVKFHDRVQPHFHIPLQSGSDDVLKRMNRKYKAKHFQDRIAALSQTREFISIGTDVIVGYPGETNEEFLETKNLLESLPITYFHVFPFSARPGTKANTLKDDVDQKTKKERVNILRRISDRKRNAFYSRFLHSSQKVFVEKHRDENHLLCAITPHYVPVRFQGDDRLKGLEVEVRLQDIRQNNQSEDYVYSEVV